MSSRALHWLARPSTPAAGALEKDAWVVVPAMVSMVVAAATTMVTTAVSATGHVAGSVASLAAYTYVLEDRDAQR